ncbi:Major facilitator superfamily domain, general substrate transporter [Penicillium griseofulvum]|uniref:Major facilitator superfamily domain, general substrate transporter n=1 Tax=Penicillium patulum TaxID=5078 RepID=A0A135L883_PENPA|nr:Major facilitator superfamily domain, general substrate transporter [Penicillium griseofulvum]KXG45166.1 Major facilitator superfamily domain, general substrate transporter [Penicillium griseofulvum]
MSTSSDPEEGFQETKDLEAAKPTTLTDPSLDSDANKDPDLITWSGPDDPENPKNWPKGLKWKNTCVISLFVFISPVSSSMIAPAMQDLGKALGMHSDLEIYLSMAIFILAYSIGPIFFGPASELYGRVRLLQASNAWYLAWNLGCGFAQTKSQLFAFRFLAGIGGSAPLAIGGGAISDMWSAEERGKAMGVYTLGPLLGPVVGPIAGGFIAQYSTWRWVFWATSATAAAVQVAGFIWLQECHPATLLRKRRDVLVQETGNNNLHTDEKVETLVYRLLHAFERPVLLFTTQPIVFCMAIYMAYLFGITYLMLATFPDIWTEIYHESSSIGGLNYISIAIGSFAGLFFNLKLVDRIYKTLKARNNGVGKPEYRMPSLAVGSFISTIGLFWYGWSIGNTHWIMPNIGALIFTAGTISCLQGMQTYIVDSYETYAASAMAACAILRSLCGFAFPLFAPYMYSALGYGWGTSVLAFITMAIGWSAPFVFYFFGPKLRAISRYAAG